MSAATIARRQMTGMPAGKYVCAMTDHGDGLFVGEWYPARDTADARRIARTVRESYGTVVTVTIAYT